MQVKNKVENMNKDNDMGSAWVSARVFVPMVDMINTGTPEEINVICRTHQSGLFVDCVTDRDIPAGTELLRTYHEGKDLSNSQFFVDFGIAFEHVSFFFFFAFLSSLTFCFLLLEPKRHYSFAHA